MTDEQQRIAEGLRDLHLPSPVTWWPLAPGWWLAMALMAGLLCFVQWRILKARHRRDPRRQAVAALNAAFHEWQSDFSQANYLHQSHSILRQLAMTLSDRAHIARLSGEQWVSWLERRSGEALPEEARFALAHGAYQKAHTARVESLHKSYVHWARQCHVVSVGSHSDEANSFPEGKARAANIEQPYA